MTQYNKCLALAVRKPTRQRIENWLQSLGHEVIWTDNVSQLLGHSELERCQLLFLHLAHHETLQACRELRARPATAMIPQVVLAENETWRISAYEAGVDAGFLRSTLHHEILARLQTLLRQKQFFQQCMARQLQDSERGREQVHDVFRRYVAPQLVDRILTGSAADASQLDAGQRLQAAVLFADMRGFTGLAERLSPALVFELLNQFFAVLTSVAVHHEGTVISMAGDSLMVGFGVPNAQPDAGIRAIRAACEMLKGFAPLAQQWLQRFGIETGLGIGINHGEVFAGNIGTDQYMNYTLIGDTVNIAARLSQRARAGEVLFSDGLKLSLDAAGECSVPVIALPPLTLRGRSTSIEIYCVPTDIRIEMPH